MNENKITFELMTEYEKIRSSGKYNMFTDGKTVMKKLRLDWNTDRQTYFGILSDYSGLMKKFGGRRIE